jgi:hypothetical protein
VLVGVRQKGIFRPVARRAEALAWLLDQAAPGDCVLIAGGAPAAAAKDGGGSPTIGDHELTRRCLRELAPAPPRRAVA